MGWIKPAAGIALIAAGVAGITYGQFTYTKEEHQANVGNLELSYKEKDTIDVPKWAGVGAISVGVILLVFGRKP
jgi:gentisate 1,2-dioxygenase